MPRLLSSVSLLLTCCFLLPALPVPAAKSADVPVERLHLREVWRRGGEDDDLFFGAPARIVHDAAGNVYVFDIQLKEVFVFSPEGEHLRNVGRVGEAPGEYNQPVDVLCEADGTLCILDSFPSRIVRLAPDGTPLENRPLPEVEEGKMRMVSRIALAGDNLLVAGMFQGMADGALFMDPFLETVDARGNPVARLHESHQTLRLEAMRFVEGDLSDAFLQRCAAFDDGRVVAPIDAMAYRIEVWGPDGSHERTISRDDDEPLVRTDEEIARIERVYEQMAKVNPNIRWELSKTHPAIVALHARDDGELWVQTSRGTLRRPEGVAVGCDVFDREGEFVRQVEIAGKWHPENDGFHLLGDHVYIVRNARGGMASTMAGLGLDMGQTDEVPLELICYRLEN